MTDKANIGNTRTNENVNSIKQGENTTGDLEHKSQSFPSLVNQNTDSSNSSSTTSTSTTITAAHNDSTSKNNNALSEKDSKKFMSFTFYKVDAKWRWLNEIGKDESAREFTELLNIANTKIKTRTYSTVGLRHDCDFMIWTVSSSLENIQVFASKIYTTILGKYVEPVYTFLSMTRKSIYSNQVKQGFDKQDSNPLKYVIVYPFIKSREWYLLPFEDRKKLMDEHIKVGRKYPDIVLNTTYSFGIGDQDFMLAFETDDVSKFQDLIIELRETNVSRYIIKDLPMIPCISKDMSEIIKSLG